MIRSIMKAIVKRENGCYIGEVRELKKRNYNASEIPYYFADGKLWSVTKNHGRINHVKLLNGQHIWKDDTIPISDEIYSNLVLTISQINKLRGLLDVTLEALCKPKNGELNAV